MCSGYYSFVYLITTDDLHAKCRTINQPSFVGKNLKVIDLFSNLQVVIVSGDCIGSFTVHITYHRAHQLPSMLG